MKAQSKAPATFRIINPISPTIGCSNGLPSRASPDLTSNCVRIPSIITNATRVPRRYFIYTTANDRVSPSFTLPPAVFSYYHPAYTAIFSADGNIEKRAGNSPRSSPSACTYIGSSAVTSISRAFFTLTLRCVR